uniref:Zinc finger, SWIM-type n=1 Tax=Tanacetum cinerariifolium TaxID=118510 RepID=A0A6L2K596_TANCI|nr:zinc finger, SWIM-type [Tanacetum cinerariifolium]
MSTPTFAKTHNLIAFLEKTSESDGFEQIVDFLNTILKIKTINEVVRLQALIDGKKVVITKASIRHDLQLNDAKGTSCLPNAVIFEELTRIGAKTTSWNEFSGTIAFAITCLASNQKFNFSKYILDNLKKNLEAGVPFYMFPKFIQVFVNHQIGDLSYHSAFRAKAKAETVLKGDAQVQHALLRDYILELQKCNPNIIGKLECYKEGDPETTTRMIPQLVIILEGEMCTSVLGVSVWEGAEEVQSTIHIKAEKCKKMKLSQDMQLIQKLRDDQKLEGTGKQSRGCFQQLSIGPLTPAATLIFNKIKEASVNYIVDWNGLDLYQVKGPHGDQCVINLTDWNFSWRKWEVSGIPCKHTVTCIHDMADNGMEVGLQGSVKRTKYDVRRMHATKITLNAGTPFATRPSAVLASITPASTTPASATQASATTPFENPPSSQKMTKNHAKSDYEIMFAAMADFIIVVVEIDLYLGGASLDYVPMAWGSFVGDDAFTVFVHFHGVFDAALSVPAAACLSKTVLI